MCLFIPLFTLKAHASQIVNPAASGGGGGSGSSIYPSTGTPSFPFGYSASTGTLTTEATISTGIPTLGQINNITFPNLITNGDLEQWRYGTGTLFGLCANTNPMATSADAWTTILGCALTDPAGVIRVTSPVKFGTYSMEFESGNTLTSGTGFYTKQLIPNVSDYVGSSVTLSAWIYITSNLGASGIGVVINDGITASTSTLLTAADNTWHQVTVTHFMSNSSTELLALIGAPTSAGNNMQFYIDGVSLVRGDVPTDYAPPNSSVSMSQIQTDPVGGIIGAPNSTSATAGDVGEYISDNQGSVAYGSGAAATFIVCDTITVSAGDWDVSGSVSFNQNAIVANSYMITAVSIFPGNTNTDGIAEYSNIYSPMVVLTGNVPNGGGTVPRFRVSAAASTPVYIKGLASAVTGSSNYMNCAIQARRVR